MSPEVAAQAWQMPEVERRRRILSAAFDMGAGRPPAIRVGRQASAPGQRTRRLVRRLLIVVALAATIPTDVASGRMTALQWRWARTGAACAILANGPGAYRLSNDPFGGSTNVVGPADWVAQFRSVFTPAATSFASEGSNLPPDASSSSIACIPAHRLSDVTAPSAATLAGVLALSRTGLAPPVPAGLDTIPVGASTTVTVRLAGVGRVAERLGAGTGPGGFWALASAEIAASGAGLPVATRASVGEDGAATLALAPTRPGPITLTLTGLGAAALRAATTQPGPGAAALDIPLSLQCATQRLPGEPLEAGTGADCVDALDPLDAPTLARVVASPKAWTLGPIVILQPLTAEESASALSPLT